MTTTDNKKLMKDLESAIKELKAVHKNREAILNELTSKAKKDKGNK